MNARPSTRMSLFGDCKMLVLSVRSPPASWSEKDIESVGNGRNEGGNLDCLYPTKTIVPSPDSPQESDSRSGGGGRGPSSTETQNSTIRALLHEIGISQRLGSSALPVLTKVLTAGGRSHLCWLRLIVHVSACMHPPTNTHSLFKCLLVYCRFAVPVCLCCGDFRSLLLFPAQIDLDNPPSKIVFSVQEVREFLPASNRHLVVTSRLSL